MEVEQATRGMDLKGETVKLLNEFREFPGFQDQLTHLHSWVSQDSLNREGDQLPRTKQDKSLG